LRIDFERLLEQLDAQQLLSPACRGEPRRLRARIHTYAYAYDPDLLGRQFQCHDRVGYRVERRIVSRNAYDWTARLAAIAAAAEQIKAKTFTIDGKAVVLGPDGLSRFEGLSRRKAADTAIRYAFDLIEHDGEDMRNRPFLDRKAALARLLRATEAGILFNEHIAEDGPCRLCARLQAWRRGHRVEEGRQHLSIRPVPRLDQGPQSRQHRRAAGPERDLNRPPQRAPAMTLNQAGHPSASFRTSENRQLTGAPHQLPGGNSLA
jgi:hypothetical protein